VNFDDFLREYLEVHTDRSTQVAHALGTFGGVALVAAALTLRKPGLLLAALAAFYLPAWLSHWVCEGNQPKLFTHPLLSLRADFVMAYRLLRGKLA